MDICTGPVRADTLSPLDRVVRGLNVKNPGTLRSVRREPVQRDQAWFVQVVMLVS